ncbi:M67 family metallopeptidase [Microvirgula aerodenitrificans]|uniref:M67 family metallopeptidase n=1 Tax=Microvirgula aerodenitrificans TaxID=57480 RepID=UPI00248DE55A|nr:M67 family metallopeptidase [Microvirgula aerodenitrificans]
MMLIIHQRLADAIVRQALADHPLESCGVLAGPAGTGVPTRCIAMDNAARSECFFRFDSHQQLRLARDMARLGQETVAIYHSHTGSHAYPSRSDIDYAADPALHYLIVSTDARYPPGLRSFRIGNGHVVEERIAAVSAYRDVRFNHGLDTGDARPATAA